MTDAVRRVRALLEALERSLPEQHSISEHFVVDYHNALTELEVAGIDVRGFAVDPGLVKHIVASGNYLTGEMNYSRDRFVERAVLLTKLRAVLGYLQEPTKPTSQGSQPGPGAILISGGNVTFGDGSHINISNVNAGDILAAFRTAIDQKVTDPEEKKTLLAKVGDVLKHPAVTTVLQTTLPELLKHLPKVGT